MGDLYEPLSRLPKNIRQIGDRDDTVRLYMEDYVSTYLKRLYPAGGQDLRVGLLLGTEKTEEGTPFIFVDGALEMEDVTAEGERVAFTEAAWKKAYQNIEESFPRRTVQGWFLCGAPGCALSPLNYWKQHGQYFGEKNQLMYLNSGLDGDESIYITSDDGFYRLKGYSIYYDKNQMMQDYMICRKDVKRVESGAGDRVIRDFRERMEDRKQEAVSQRHTVRNLGLLCSTMSVVILAGGVAMINNYQKMQEMETALVSVLPEGARPWDREDGREESVPVVVEEIKGNLYPADASGEKEEKAGEADGMAEGAGKGEAQAEQAEDGAEVTIAAGSEAEDSQISAGEKGKGEFQAADRTGISGAEKSGEGEAAAGETGGEARETANKADRAEGEETADGAPEAAGDEGQGGENGAEGSEKAQVDADSEKAGEEEADESETEAEDGKAGKGKDGKADENGQAGEGAVPATDMKPGGRYLVGEGETLYGICFKLYGNINCAEDICALNGVSDVNHIMAGQKLILPAEVPVLEEMEGAVEE